jgi:hypothetical protein
MDWMDVAIDAGFKLGDRVLARLFTPPKKGDSDPILMAPGLATGYYYNFLDVVGQQLSSGVITLNDNPRPQDGGGGGVETTFNLDTASLQIIMPERLDGSAFQRCNAEFDLSQKGSVFLNANRRYYGVNYRISELSGQKYLTIIDYARPVTALKRYYEDVLRMDTFSGSADARWTELQKAELMVFEQTLKRLQERGYAVLTNKLDFLRRG